MREALKVFGGSVLVYVIVAACSASGRSGQTARSDAGGSSGATSSAGAGGMSTGGATAAAGAAGHEGTAGSLGAAGAGPVDAGIDDALDALADAMTDPVDEAEAYVSGTRLKARRWVTTDGAKQAIGWYDSERDENCNFYVSGDGKTRCLPFDAYTTVNASYFADSGCTQPVIYHGVGCGVPEPPVYAYKADAATCPPRYRLYSLGSEIASGKAYVKSGINCTEMTLCASATTCRLYNMGAEVAASSFVAATEQTDD
jgi:hypothetical protein